LKRLVGTNTFWTIGFKITETFEVFFNIDLFKEKAFNITTFNAEESLIK
jgi:hypothetical protein